MATQTFSYFPHWRDHGRTRGLKIVPTRVEGKPSIYEYINLDGEVQGIFKDSRFDMREVGQGFVCDTAHEYEIINRSRK